MMNQRRFIQQSNNHQQQSNSLLSILIFNQTTPPTRMNDKIYLQDFHGEYHNGNTINLKRFNSNSNYNNSNITNGYLNNFNYQVNYSLGGNDSGNYYFSGVLFMISIIGLLLYVNLYYENCFTDTMFRVSKWRFCYFLKYCFIISRKSANRENNNTKLQTNGNLKKNSVQESFDYENEYSDDEEENDDDNHDDDDDQDDDDDEGDDQNHLDEIVIQQYDPNKKVKQKDSKRNELISCDKNTSQQPILSD